MKSCLCDSSSVYDSCGDVEAVRSLLDLALVNFLRACDTLFYWRHFCRKLGRMSRLEALNTFRGAFQNSEKVHKPESKFMNLGSSNDDCNSKYCSFRHILCGYFNRCLMYMVD